MRSHALEEMLTGRSPFRPFFEWCVGVRPVEELQVWVLLLTPVVVDVDPVSAARPHARLDENEPGYVLDSGELVFFQVLEEFRLPGPSEGGFADLPAVGDDG